MIALDILVGFLSFELLASIVAIAITKSTKDDRKGAAVAAGFLVPCILYFLLRYL